MSIALLIFLATIASSLYALYGPPSVLERTVFQPYWLRRRNDWHTLLTSGFVHADLAHLAFNMLTYWFFAFPLERRIGGAAFAVLYFVSLVLSDLGTYLKHRNDSRYASLGASGAVSAVLLASIVYHPTMSLYVFPLPIPIPGPLYAVLYVGYSWYAARVSRDRINHDAHLGGALTGLVFVLLTDPQAYGTFARTLLG